MISTDISETCIGKLGCPIGALLKGIWIAWGWFRGFSEGHLAGDRRQRVCVEPAIHPRPHTLSRQSVAMRKRTCDDCPDMEWVVDDALASQFDDRSFDLVVDKGTLDAIACGGDEMAATLLRGPSFVGFARRCLEGAR